MNIEESYSLDLEEIITLIKKKAYKTVMIQLPDGLKGHATEIADKIGEATDAKVFIWGGSNYGACDIPTGISRFKIDLLINFGHAKFYGNQIYRDR